MIMPSPKVSSATGAVAVILVENAKPHMFNITRDAVAASDHDNQGRKSGKGHADRIANKLHGLAPCISPKAAQIEAPGGRLRRRGGGTYCFFIGCNRLIFELDPACFREIGNECIFQSSTAPLADELRWWPICQNFTGIHQRDSVAALGLIHEMGRDEDRDAIVTRQMDERAPKFVPFNRVHP